MATPFSKVYDSFLGKVKDYSFINLNNEGLLDGVFLKYLKSSIVKFYNSNLEIDEESGTFTTDLTLEEIEILANCMVYFYVDGKTTDVKNMEQIMTEPEFKVYSQANHLKELLSLKSSKQSDISQMMNIYSLKKGLEDFS